MVLLGDLGESVPLFLLAYTVAFLGYLIAIGTGEGLPFKIVLTAGLTYRAILLLGDPSLSDDIYRYIWDGLVQLAEINPFEHAPESPALTGVGYPQILARVNHSDLETIYPPFAQLFFRLCAWLSPGTLTVRAGLVVWDLVAVLFLSGLARSYDLHPSVSVIYFWNPLVILEGAGQGHIDIMAVSLVVVALLYVRMHAYGRAGAALALAALTKLLPIVLLPAFWRWAGRAEADGRSTVVAMVASRAVLVPLAFLAALGVGYAPFSGIGWDVLGSLGRYATDWEFNAAVAGLLRGAGVDGGTSRWIVGAVFVCAVAVFSIRSIPPIQAAYYTMGAFILLTPTLHPWYVVWIVPFLCFYGNRGWIALTGTIPLAYVILIEYRTTGVWSEQGWVRWTLFGIAALVWVFPLVQARIRNKKGEPSSDGSPRCANP
ncbi:MAG: hypothetical protein CME21_15365 [Gemmatimonadetes bacterium]|nr:hypothetical protein [Gemmatimonadota bacterium]